MQQATSYLVADAGFLPELTRDADGTLVSINGDEAP